MPTTTDCRKMAGSPTSDRASARACRSTIRGSMPSKPDLRPSTARHHVVASYVWNLPKLSGSNALVRNVVGRMAMDRHLLLHVRRSADHPGGNRPIPDRQQHRSRGLHRVLQANSASRPSSQRGGCTGVKHCLPWLNPALFAKPAAGNYGNAGKGTWRGPNLWDVDTGLLKNILPVRRRMKTSTSSSAASSSTCSTIRNGPIRT